MKRASLGVTPSMPSMTVRYNLDRPGWEPSELQATARQCRAKQTTWFGIWGFVLRIWPVRIVLLEVSVLLH